MLFKPFFIGLWIILLTACGGGGDSSDNGLSGTGGAQGIPDLAITGIRVSTTVGSVGSTVIITATVHNTGAGAAVATMLRYYQSTDNQITAADTLLHSDTLSALAANSSQTVSRQIQLPMTAQTVYYGLCVDLVPNETATANNCSSAVMVIAISLLPMQSTVTLTLSGRVTYEDVPFAANNRVLNFDASTTQPVRGAIVQVLDAQTVESTPVVLASTHTDLNGNYQVEVTVMESTRTVVRVRAEYLSYGDAIWPLRVVDNTNNGALYVLDSTATASGLSVATVNLHASSGWIGGVSGGYTQPRVAAPFHILDNAFTVLQKLVAEDSDIQINALVINWSPHNRSISGNVSSGNIITTHYRRATQQIYVLGDVATDTDEYDDSVLAHEICHHLEESLSRSDSPGGRHRSDNILDMRLAFNEGWCYAFASIMLGDPVLRDSSGPPSQFGYSALNIDNYIPTTPGWYVEESIQSLIYDLYDLSNNSTDVVNLGFTPMYNVMVSSQRTTPAYVSIFTFMTYLKEEVGSTMLPMINQLLVAHRITTQTDIYGTNETNDAGNSDHVLPIYTRLEVNGALATLCSIDDFQDPIFKRFALSVTRFIYFNLPTSNIYTIRASPTGPHSTNTNVGFRISLRELGGHLSFSAGNGASETLRRGLQSGLWRGAFYNYQNTLLNTSATFDGCFTIGISTEDG